MIYRIIDSCAIFRLCKTNGPTAYNGSVTLKIKRKQDFMRAKLLVFATACIVLGSSGGTLSAQNNSDFEVVWKKMMGENEENYTRHVVRQGETLFGLSRKYGVTLQWVRENNPFTQKRTLQIGDVLLFPATSMRAELGLTDPPENINQRSRYDRKEAMIHVIGDNETLYSISRRYGVKVNELLATNPVMDRNTIHISDTLMIPLKLRQNAADKSISDPNNNPTMVANFTHVVNQGETLWSLARKYGVNVEDLVDINIGIVDNIIGIGDTLAILPQADIEQIKRGTLAVPEYREIVQDNRDRAARKGIHIVSEGETIFGLAQQYNTSLDELRDWNYLESDELSDGQKLLVRDVPVAFFDEGYDKEPEPEVIVMEAGSGEVQGRVTEEYYVPDGATKVSVVGADDEDITIFDMDEENFSSRGNERRVIETPSVQTQQKEVVLEEYVDNSTADSEDFFDGFLEDEDLVDVAKEDLTTEYQFSEDVINTQNDAVVELEEAAAVLPAETSPPIPSELEEAELEEVEFEEDLAEMKADMDEKTRMIIHDVDYSKLNPIYHMVESHETLAMISKQYNQQELVLKEWNSLDSEKLDGRPKLIIGWYLPTEGESVVTATPTKVSFRQQYVNMNNNQIKYKLVSDRGVCTWLKDDSKLDENLYILHRHAPRDAIVRITNPLNRKAVYAKVIGKMPRTSANEGVNMKLSYAIVKRLGLLDDRFMLEWVFHEKR